MGPKSVLDTWGLPALNTLILLTSGATITVAHWAVLKERRMQALIAQGASNKGIARTLGIAETTVKIHVQHILRKLKISSRVQAAVMVTGTRR